MAEPGDHDPEAPAADPDAEIGFCTPESLSGESRRPTPGAEVEAEPAPGPEPVAEPAPDLADAPAAPVAAPAEPAPGPDWRDAVAQAPAAVASEVAASRNRSAGGAPEGATTLYAVYVLILFAVPTFGASALLGLLAVIGREGPSDPLAQSHFLFQRRTLWTAAIVAVMGAILIIVGIGVFVLFALALWTIWRGAFGVLRLKADRPIDNPRSWLT